MKVSDRIFGLLVMSLALAYMAGALTIRRGVMSDPLGPQAFPMLIGAVALLCGAVMVARPNEEPEWPRPATLGNLALAAAIMVAYAYALIPFGFLIPTALAAGAVSYQITPRVIAAALSGAGLSAGLFAIFRFVLGLGLRPWPQAFGG